MWELTIHETAKMFAREILLYHGYNYCLSMVEMACEYLDHPELTEDDEENYHGWADPYPRRCYCGEIGYTEDGRWYANDISEEQIKLMREVLKDPTIKSKFKTPYQGTGEGFAFSWKRSGK